MADRFLERRGLALAVGAIGLLLAVAGLVRLTGGDAGRVVPPAQAEPTAPPSTPTPPPTPRPSPSPSPTSAPTPAEPRPVPGDGIFDRNRFLVAYYGTGQTDSLGVLGETGPVEMDRRLRRAARAFARPGRTVQPVYELIVTVADRVPGLDRDFSHDIPRSVVERYVRTARRTGALLLLDLQPGRSRFVEVARRWEWALRQPHVGLALDPEWRMGRGQVPGRVIGSVGAREVNLTSAWLEGVRGRHDLPEKLFVLHQFRPDMVRDITTVARRPGLAMVQHVDGFGTPAQKRATYAHVARPRRFTMGFKLFYDEDVRRMSAAAVHRLHPEVRFVSFQ